MARRTIKRLPKLPEFMPLVRHYLGQRMMRERSEVEEKRDKAELMTYLEERGEPHGDEGQHQILHLPEVLPYQDAKGEQKKVRGVIRMKRVSQNLNPDKTMTLLERKKLVKDCTEVITETVINEDAILAANYEGKITDAELKRLYDEDVQYAFYLDYE